MLLTKKRNFKTNVRNNTIDQEKIKFKKISVVAWFYFFFISIPNSELKHYLLNPPLSLFSSRVDGSGLSPREHESYLVVAFRKCISMTPPVRSLVGRQEQL